MPENKMEVLKTEDPDGVILKIKFLQGDGKTFKGDMKAWLILNYPTMDFEEFFNRLEEYAQGRCTINMQ